MIRGECCQGNVLGNSGIFSEGHRRRALASWGQGECFRVFYIFSEGNVSEVLAKSGG